MTAGIVDLHSHLGDDASPGLSGAADTNSRKGITQPWLRSLDGLNTHDESYRLSISGGITTAVVLPGSANAIGTFEIFATMFLQFDLSLEIIRWSSVPHQTATHIRKVIIFDAFGVAIRVTAALEAPEV